MARKRRKLGEILQDWGLVTEQQVNEALRIGQGTQKRIGEVLVEMGYIKDTDVAKALASQFGLDYIEPDQPDVIKKEAIALLPIDVIKKYLVLPLDKSGGVLKLLIHDPMDLETLDTLSFRLMSKIETAVGAKSKIKQYIDEMLREDRQSIDKAVREMTVDSTRDTSIDLKGLTIDQKAEQSAEEAEAAAAPVIRLVKQIISDAVRIRASDIHIEPFINRVRLRYRVDGVCQEQNHIPKRAQAAVVARIKILSGMKIQEKRVPQDGRIKLKVDGIVFDFRVSACPAYHGESVVMRILRPDSARLGLEKLGMRADTTELFTQMIRRPNGIFLVTGPTGSGKTTTLYTALDILNRPDKKIITAEDPVEYNFKGINQCQVNMQIGLDFAKILRAMLRQAPNIILVGEIRDTEVAEVAVQAALTGHLVFSTLHTNDASSSITRLVDMGVKPFLIASSIQAVLAQRLVRLLCESCKKPDTSPDPKLMRLCGFKPENLVGKTIYKAVGCNKCENLGYRGREGVYEMMTMNPELRDLAFKRAPVNQIRAAAINAGMRPLLADGKLKVLDGRTTADEVAKIAQVEGVVDMTEEER